MVTNYFYAYIKQVSFGIERRNRFGVALCSVERIDEYNNL